MASTQIRKVGLNFDLGLPERYVYLLDLVLQGFATEGRWWPRRLGQCCSLVLCVLQCCSHRDRQEYC